jgi:hypothetical protein
MQGRKIAGYAYSFVTKMGKERIVMSSFGTSKTKASIYFNQQNQGKLEPIKRHKLYQVTVHIDKEIRSFQEP